MKFITTISSFITAIMPYLVFFNFILICALVKKIHRFDQTFKMHRQRQQDRIEKDTMEALTLLRSGNAEEAKRIAERIINS